MALVKPGGRKRCGRCKQWKEPVEDHFKPHRTYGWQSYCNDCASKSAQVNYKKNRPARLAYQRNYNRTHRGRHASS